MADSPPPTYDGSSKAVHVLGDSFSVVPSAPPSPVPVYLGQSPAMMATDKSPANFDLSTLGFPPGDPGATYYEGMSPAIHVFGEVGGTPPPPEPILSFCSDPLASPGPGEGWTGWGISETKGPHDIYPLLSTNDFSVLWDWQCYPSDPFTYTFGRTIATWSGDSTGWEYMDAVFELILTSDETGSAEDAMILSGLGQPTDRGRIGWSLALQTRVATSVDVGVQISVYSGEAFMSGGVAYFYTYSGVDAYYNRHTDVGQPGNNSVDDVVQLPWGNVAGILHIEGSPAGALVTFTASTGEVYTQFFSSSPLFPFSYSDNLTVTAIGGSPFLLAVRGMVRNYHASVRQDHLQLWNGPVPPSLTACEDGPPPAPPVPPGDNVSIAFRPQIGDPTTSLDAHICMLESGAMALEWQTQGAVSVWGGELVPWCGRDPALIALEGTNLENVAQAWLHWGQTFDIRAGQSWANLMASLAQARAVVLGGDYGVMDPAYSCDIGYTGNHAIVLLPYFNSGGDILVGDPLCRNFRFVPEYVLRAYAEAHPSPIYFGCSRPWPA